MHMVTSPPSSTERTEKTEKTARQTELSESDKKKIDAMQRPSDMDPGDSWPNIVCSGVHVVVNDDNHICYQGLS